MPYATGVTRTSENQQTVRRPGLIARGWLVPVVAALLAVTATFAPASPSVGTAAAGAQPKAVFISAPTNEMTAGNLEDSERMAQQAEAAGMDVRRVFYPNATWEKVLENIQGASLVVYMGHGYGWPSPYTSKLTESRQNGFGLNSYAGSGPAEYTYYGATPIRQNVRLAPNAVVMLFHGCYTAGNGESYMPIPSPDLARERVDNYANGFLAAGAGAVFALAWGTWMDYPAALMNADNTMDGLFMTPGEHVGWKDMYFDSVRTPGAKNHLDPAPDSGYHRAVTGRLSMTTAEWRAGAGQIVPPPPPPDGVPLMTMATPTKNQLFAADADSLMPSTTFKINLAVPSPVDWRIVDAAGATVRTIRAGQQTPAGATSFNWNGKSDSGEWVPDGTYRSIATANTVAGSITLEKTVFVGAFQIKTALPTAVRGTTLKVTLVSTEPLSGNPTVVVTQPGQAPRTFTATHKTGKKYAVSVPMLSGDAGTVTFVVTGRDKNGGSQSSSRSMPLN